MAKAKKREEVITFKADDALLEAMAGISNRSAFIRKAILDALGNTCPICGGTGFLSTAQLQHWKDFSTNHRITECSDCHELHLVCEHESRQSQ